MVLLAALERRIGSRVALLALLATAEQGIGERVFVIPALLGGCTEASHRRFDGATSLIRGGVER